MTLHTLILIFHILGAGLLIGIAFLSLFATIKPLDAGRITALRFVSRFGIWGSIWQLLTGIALAAGEWSEFSHSKIFWTKIILYVIEGTFASLLLGKKVKLAEAGQQPSDTRLAFLTHAVLIALIASLGVLLVESGT